MVALGGQCQPLVEEGPEVKGFPELLATVGTDLLERRFGRWSMRP